MRLFPIRLTQCTALQCNAAQRNATRRDAEIPPSWNLMTTRREGKMQQKFANQPHFPHISERQAPVTNLKRRHSRKTAVRHPHAMPFSSHRCGQAPNLPTPKTSPEQAPRTKTSPQSGTTSVTSKPCNPYLPPTSSLSPGRNLHIHPSSQPATV